MALASQLSAQGEDLGVVTETATVIEASEKVIEEVVLPMPKLDNDLLLAICSCESGDGKGTVNHYELDGVTPLKGKHTPAIYGEDIGMCQINTKYHLDSSKKLGLDIYTPEGNWKYAKHLLATQGTQPWKSSARCWNK